MGVILLPSPRVRGEGQGEGLMDCIKVNGIFKLLLSDSDLDEASHVGQFSVESPLISV